MEVTLTKQEAEAILNYLASKPYAEVFQLIGLLQSKATPQPEVVKEEKKK